MSNRDQKEIFLNEEGDSWFNRNKCHDSQYLDKVPPFLELLLKYIDKNSKVLEIGCCNGRNLKYIREKTGAECYGIEPSEKAVEFGSLNFSDIKLNIGTADDLPFKADFFDFVFFGFCLYLIDRKLLSKTIAEADRVLKSDSFLA
ncbi:MAG: methyltransferase domain-containing protein, partial [Candidatus Lokiarchaeota archaeon]|nr:methyltransferase domain-containing protein [Candidatus Lokiarchaeota archaeon]